MKRRGFLKFTAGLPLAAALAGRGFAMPRQDMQAAERSQHAVKLFLSGDVMTGRGIDQVLPNPGDPQIFESYARSARDYVQLAEQLNGPIPAPVDFDWIWGDALAVLQAAAPDVRIINLETAITRRGTPWPGKGIQYRMNPANIPCLTAASVDCCVLANNHVLDWGHAGFKETLASLATAGISVAGAGADRSAAQSPSILARPDGGRVLVFAGGLQSSGIPPQWAATSQRPGVNFLRELSARTAGDITAAVQAHKRPGDVVVVSLHWGGNWGYDIPAAHRRFARRLIDAADVDVVHGHSSHHPLGLEVYRGRPILYGCGDLIDDYEGIRRYEEYRIELALLYLVTLDPQNGGLVSLDMVPLRRHRFRLRRASAEETDWLAKTLDRECRPLGSRVMRTTEGTLRLAWEGQ